MIQIISIHNKYVLKDLESGNITEVLLNKNSDELLMLLDSLIVEKSGMGVEMGDCVTGDYIDVRVLDGDVDHLFRRSLEGVLYAAVYLESQKCIDEFAEKLLQDYSVGAGTDLRKEISNMDLERFAPKAISTDASGFVITGRHETETTRHVREGLEYLKNKLKSEIERQTVQMFLRMVSLKAKLFLNENFEWGVVELDASSLNFEKEWEAAKKHKKTEGPEERAVHCTSENKYLLIHSESSDDSGTVQFYFADDAKIPRVTQRGKNSFFVTLGEKERLLIV